MEEPQQNDDNNSTAERDLPLPVLDPVADYEKLHRIGEGTYGVTYKAKDRTSGAVVALKKVRFDRSRDGVPLTSVREIRVLQECRHPNIVTLHRVVTGSKPDSVFLVFEYLEHDMGRLLDTMPRPFTLSEVKCLVQQLISAVAYLHRRWVVHRDIKMSNLLYSSKTGLLKLCDFGLARYFAPEPSAMTPRVVTLWYRAPEILLGAEVYSEKVDMWAVGCVMGELLRHAPLFPAKNELECLRMQCDLLGTPTPASWPGMTSLPHASMFKLPDQPVNHLTKHLGAAAGGSASALGLLQALLTWDPDRRISAEDALDHPFFKEHPLPTPTHKMPSFMELADNVAGHKLQLHKQGHHHHQHHHHSHHHHSHVKRGHQDMAGDAGQAYDAKRVALLNHHNRQWQNFDQQGGGPRTREVVLRR